MAAWAMSSPQRKSWEWDEDRGLAAQGTKRVEDGVYDLRPGRARGHGINSIQRGRVSQPLQSRLRILRSGNPASSGYGPTMHTHPSPVAQPCKAMASPQRNHLESSLMLQTKDCRSLCLLPSAKSWLPKHIGSIMRNNGIKIM